MSLKSAAPLSGDDYLVVLGAGADVPLGFPTVADLGRSLTSFANGDGAEIDAALRLRLKNLRFHLGMVVGDAGEELVRRLFEDPQSLGASLRSIRSKMGDAEARGPVGEVLDQLCDMADKNETSPELARRLGAMVGREVQAGERGLLLDPRRLALDPVVREVIRSTFEQVLLTGVLSSQEREFVGAVVAATSNIEELLATLFLGFAAQGLLAEKKKYLYLVWLLWAYIRVRSIECVQSGRESVCQVIANLGVPVITFNYTDFFYQAGRDRVCHFHGSHRAYLKLDERIEVDNDKYLLGADSVSAIARVIRDRLRLDVTAADALDVPAIVPPLSFKPVMSPDRLRAWSRADSMIQRARSIVIIGYSFSQVDAHFNALLRGAPDDASIVTVNPDVIGTTGRLLRALGIEAEEQPLSSDEAPSEIAVGRVRGIKASAEQLGPKELEELLRSGTLLTT